MKHCQNRVRRIVGLGLCSIALAARQSAADGESGAGVDPFGGRPGCVVDLDVADGGETRAGSACGERRSPCSTFKIPNSGSASVSAGGNASR